MDFVSIFKLFDNFDYFTFFMKIQPQNQNFYKIKSITLMKTTSNIFRYQDTLDFTYKRNVYFL